jgi:hypothetical protein
VNESQDENTRTEFGRASVSRPPQPVAGEHSPRTVLHDNAGTYGVSQYPYLLKVAAFDMVDSSQDRHVGDYCRDVGQHPVTARLADLT